MMANNAAQAMMQAARTRLAYLLLIELRTLLLSKYYHIQ
jgi:hypothetical protein